MSATNNFIKYQCKMKEILKDIFTKPYQGKSFVLDSLLKPLLGDYKPSNEDILHNSERKKLAENANVKAITRIAEFELEDWVSYEKEVKEEWKIKERERRKG